jgi:hypothetical protein
MTQRIGWVIGIVLAVPSACEPASRELADLVAADPFVADADEPGVPDANKVPDPGGPDPAVPGPEELPVAQDPGTPDPGLPDPGTVFLDVKSPPQCGSPYPSPCEVDGQTACCGCASDYDCQSQFPAIAGCVCDLQRHDCIDPQGETCQSVLGLCAICKTDADCSPSGSGTARKCDAESGVCYDTIGECDGLTACCKFSSGGLGCTDLLELILGTPSAPGMPMPGSVYYCTCKTDDDCFGGLPCLPLPILCSAFMAPCGTLPDDKRLCVDLAALTKKASGK